jgi:hypothetical protein
MRFIAGLVPLCAVACGRLGFDEVCVEGAPVVLDRSEQWVGGTAQGTTAGNPGPVLSGRPTWSYEWSGGGGLGAADAWFAQEGTLLPWDDDWFGQGRGVWAFADNELPLIDRRELTQAFDVTRVAVIRLQNHLDVSLAIRTSGTLQILWQGYAGSTPATLPIDVEAVLAHVDAGHAVVAKVVAERIAKPTSSTTPETATAVVPERTLMVDPGDSIMWSVRPTVASAENAWITVVDDGLALDVRPCAP